MLIIYVPLINKLITYQFRPEIQTYFMSVKHDPRTVRSIMSTGNPMIIYQCSVSNIAREKDTVAREIGMIAKCVHLC